jgi:hypothetical protein
MLAQLFSTISLPPNKPNHLTDPPSAFCELKHAIHRLQSNKSGDDIGVVAEMLRYLPDDFLGTLLTLHNDVLRDGFCRWQSHRGQSYEPISDQLPAFVCYTTTAKVTYKLEEHLLTANIVIDCFLAVGLPVWVVSLGLSM